MHSRRSARPAVTTIGRIAVEPNGAAVVPGVVRFTIDVRHPDPQALQSLYARHEALMSEVATRRGLDISWNATLEKTPCLNDPELIKLFSAAAAGQGVPSTVMASGAGHDTQQMAKIAKTVMLFVRSKDGRSHTTEEFSSTADIVCGIRVLAAGLHALAY